jgi:hypothetical protein
MRLKNTHFITMLVALLIASLFAQSASAGKFHFNSLDFSLGGSMLVQCSLVGLGNEIGLVTLTGYGTVRALCQNNGGNQAPGRNPIVVDMQETGTFMTDTNGRAFVEVIAPDPESPEFAPSPTPKQAGCPNGNWTVVGIVDGSTNWTAAEIVVKDEADAVRIHLSFICTTFFEDGMSTSIECVEL